MALACKCDKCGSFFDPLENSRVNRVTIKKASITKDTRNPIDIENFDLCEPCFKFLVNWLNVSNNEGGKEKC